MWQQFDAVHLVKKNPRSKGFLLSFPFYSKFDPQKAHEQIGIKMSTYRKKRGEMCVRGVLKEAFERKEQDEILKPPFRDF